MISISPISFNPKLKAIKSYNAPVSFSGEDRFYKSSQANDSFVKQDTATSKKSFILNEEMSGLGVVGAAFLTGLALATGMSRVGDEAKYIFFDKDGYTVDKEAKTIESSQVFIDANKGIYKVKAAGIDIDPSRFDSMNVKKGVYKNSAKGIDIDLLNKKYIDPENGIFVDPENEISSVTDGNRVEHIAVPAYSFDYLDNVLSPDHPRTTLQKQDRGIFFSMFDSLTSACLDENESLVPKADIFGRSILLATDNGGKNYLTSIPNDAPKIYNGFLIDGKFIDQVSQTSNNDRFKAYLKNHPTYNLA